MKLLVNHSNHPHTKWEESQKTGWNMIIDVPFPNVSASASTEDVIKLVEENLEKIQREIQREIENMNPNVDVDIYLMLQGEYTYCYTMYRKVQGRFKLALPTTERIVQELPNGQKISQFRFQRWRIIE